MPCMPPAMHVPHHHTCPCYTCLPAKHAPHHACPLPHMPPPCMSPAMHAPHHHACPARYYEMRSMSGPCTSYWNAFLFRLYVLMTSLRKIVQQECIPVGCMPSAVAISPAMPPAMHAPCYVCPPPHTPPVMHVPLPCMPPTTHASPTLPHTYPCVHAPPPP